MGSKSTLFLLGGESFKRKYLFAKLGSWSGVQQCSSSLGRWINRGTTLLICRLLPYQCHAITLGLPWTRLIRAIWAVIGTH